MIATYCLNRSHGPQSIIINLLLCLYDEYLCTCVHAYACVYIALILYLICDALYICRFWVK